MHRQRHSARFDVDYVIFGKLVACRDEIAGKNLLDSRPKRDAVLAEGEFHRGVYFRDREWALGRCSNNLW